MVWNEGALPFEPRLEYTDGLRALAAETGAHLVIGYAVETENGYRNEAIILTPEGQFQGPFGKVHPVSWSGETSVTHGPCSAYDTSVGRLGMIICYDLDFTDTARKVARHGAQLIAVPSFDWPAIAGKTL
ncbi:carbon-nitrogen hydrolase family protein [Moorella sulfitireducens]|uniref:carbon-nitrogen hydrolase family protein n=1 Tax=Neomoorella sulfitireducens TaxID=2972948 RepID=UPI0021ACA494